MVIFNKGIVLIFFSGCFTAVPLLPSIAKSQEAFPDTQGETRRYDSPSIAKDTEPIILNVGTSGNAKYRSIQVAIDAASAGSMIRIAPGVYEERLKIDKPLTLEGAGWDQTTIMMRNDAADTFEEATQLFAARIRTAKSDEERMAIKAEFEAEIKEKLGTPTLLVTNADGVVIRDIKFTSPGRHLEGRSMPVPILRFSNVKVAMSGCAVIGSPGDGIHVVGGSDVEIRDSLVAAVWSTGIVVTQKDSMSPKVSVLDSDLRNCHYAGIRIRPGCNSTVVERCRISGAAWHGIRYDNASPTIVGNLIFGNARCGIYASGETSALVKQNVFFKNEMDGISCWANNKDTIERNTFASNLREGLIIIGESQPTIIRNIFFGHPKAVIRSPIRDGGASTREAPLPNLEGNLYWKNEADAIRFVPKPDSVGKVPEQTSEEVPIPETGSVAIDPMFTNASGKEFSLVMDSPARQAGIGVADPIEFKSPWPLQAEEIAIIPDGETRDSRKWKKQARTMPAAKKSATSRKSKADTIGLPSIALLYHKDSDVRIRAIKTLADSAHSGLIDDLIRAHCVENYTPVHNVYGRALRSMTGQRNVGGKGGWKAWQAGEVKAGRLRIDYIAIDVNSLDPEQQNQIQTFATHLGVEHFKEMAETLTTGEYDRRKFYEALRYMVANDNRSEVQQFVSGNWLSNLFTHRNIDINSIAYLLNGLANPGPLRDAIDTQVRTSLDSENPVVVANALHLLAGVKGFSTVFTVPGVEETVKRLLDSSDGEVALQARRAMQKINPGWGISYEEAFIDLHKTLGQQYPCFELKGIDWKAVGEEFLPRAKQIKTDEEFGLVCMELVARLEDNHATLLDGTAKMPAVSWPRWDPGFVCLEDDQQRAVVYYVDKDSPAEKAGVKVGMIVIRIDEESSKDAIERTINRLKKYIGYSSERYLRYHAYRFFTRQAVKGAIVKFEMLDDKHRTHNFELAATLGVRYLPRLPVPNSGIKDSANVSWKMLDDEIGYIYVRRIKNDLIESLDKAVAELKDARGLIIDVRGNSGGGFDSKRAHLNFALDKDSEEPERPRYKGPMVLLIDSRCISAGEGWASWFAANKRARLFGEATAGASSRKATYELKNGLYKVKFPVKAYKGYLDRPIERLGLKPNVPVFQNAQDLIEQHDTVLQAAKGYLLENVK